MGFSVRFADGSQPPMNGIDADKTARGLAGSPAFYPWLSAPSAVEISYPIHPGPDLLHLRSSAVEWLLRDRSANLTERHFFASESTAHLISRSPEWGQFSHFNVCLECRLTGGIAIRDSAFCREFALFVESGVTSRPSHSASKSAALPQSLPGSGGRYGWRARSSPTPPHPDASSSKEPPRRWNSAYRPGRDRP